MTFNECRPWQYHNFGSKTAGVGLDASDSHQATHRALRSCLWSVVEGRSGKEMQREGDLLLLHQLVEARNVVPDLLARCLEHGSPA